jgi:carboxyl-terminal processing protease
VSIYNNPKSIIRLPIIVAITLVAGVLIGATFFGNSNSNDLMKSLFKFREVMNYVDREYVDSVNTEMLVETAIVKMLDKLDPHSVYIPAKDMQMANAQLEGDFEGIGVEFNILKDTIVIVAPISGGPSETVGVMAGDKIISVDGETVAGVKINTEGVFKRLRGKKGSVVNIEVRRSGSKQLLPFKIIRDKIPTYSVDAAYMVDKVTGYIKVSRFAANTYDEFKSGLDKLKAQGMKQLLLDLRDNPGGYMDRATKMVDEMLAGDKLIVYTDGKGTKYDNKFFAERKGVFEEGAIVVLINEGSASASEIVSGAIQDNDRGLVAGRRSYGKGLVQMPIPLSDGSQLRLTISRYYTPSGRSIQKPYSNEDEEDEYGMDLVRRFNKGEFFSADSIKFNDSLKYKTTKGRIVYGGGGIMPDVFIPRDTSQFSTYFGKLNGKNIIREFSLKYYTEHKNEFSVMKLEDYVKSYEVSDAILNELIEKGKTEGIEYDEVGFNRSKNIIKGLIKANISRSAWNRDGFFPVWNQYDDEFLQALKLFDKAKDIEKSKPKK